MPSSGTTARDQPSQNSLPPALLVRPQGSIRPFHPSDAPTLALGANNHNISRWLRDRFPHPYRLEDAEAWIHACITSSPMYNFAITNSKNAVIGGIGLMPNSPTDVHALCMDIGYWLSEEYWGRSIMSDVLPAFTDWVFEVARPDLQRLAAAVFEGNKASERVLDKAGFIHEGTLRCAAVKEGKVLDEEIYSWTRKDWQKRRDGLDRGYVQYLYGLSSATLT